MCAAAPLNWIGASLHHCGPPFGPPSRRVFKKASCSFRRIFHNGSLSPGVLLPLDFAPGLWSLPQSPVLVLTLLVVVVNLRFWVWWALMDALHRRWAARSTAAHNFRTVLAHVVQLFVSPPTHRKRTRVISITRREWGRHSYGRGLRVRRRRVRLWEMFTWWRCWGI